MAKISLHKPILIMLYGFPGSGKTFFARQFSEDVNIAHLNSDRIRYELLEQPTYSKEETSAIHHLMEYLAEEFIRAGVSVVFDINASKLADRRALRDLARRLHAESLLAWFQVSYDNALSRSMSRDKRKADDKYAPQMSRDLFERMAHGMQNPTEEDYVVISGMHTFAMQRSSVLKKLYERGLVDQSAVGDKVVKPGLVNLVPNRNQPPTTPGGRVDLSRRNIFIR